MKRLIFVSLALLLFLPAVSLAGSATSMWDLIIGVAMRCSFMLFITPEVRLGS
jgi:hypothetical protein